MSRPNRSERRLSWFLGRLDRSRTPKQRLLVACEWLVAEAWANEQVAAAEAAVVTAVFDIRNEEVSDDYRNYAR